MPATALEQKTFDEPRHGQSWPDWNSCLRASGLFLIVFLLLIVTHFGLLSLPYFWDEAGYYIPAARDLLAGSLIPHSTPSNAHPPLVMAWLALAWKVLGQSVLVTRCAMLAFATFSLLGFFRLAKTAANGTVAVSATILVAIYPVFFAQSSLAQVDLPAAGLIFWGLEAYLRGRSAATLLWFSLAVLAKETAVLVPGALCAWELLRLRLKAQESGGDDRPGKKHTLLLPLLGSVVPLALWYWYHYHRTGYVLGNPEFVRYNLAANLSPLRIGLALLLRIWQTFAYLNLYLMTLACLLAMRYPPQPLLRFKGNAIPSEENLRRRISLSTQFTFVIIIVVYLGALSVLGGAVLARYMLPIVPLVILVCVSTVWRRLRPWQLVLGIVAVAFVVALFVNPPYGFSPEDNLAYADYVRMHQRAAFLISSRYPKSRVLTAWPGSDELSRPYLGYLRDAINVVRIEDFTPEQLIAAADQRSHYDVAFVFSTKYRPRLSALDRWPLWRDWKIRFFGYHEDLTPAAAASVLGGTLVYTEQRNGQWVGIILVEGVQEARAQLARPTQRINVEQLASP